MLHVSLLYPDITERDNLEGLYVLPCEKEGAEE